MMRWSLAALLLALSTGCTRQSSESPAASPPRPLLAQPQALAAVAAPTPYPTRVPRPMPTRTAAPPVPVPTSASPQPSPAQPTTPSAGGRTWIAVDEVGAPAWTHGANGATTWADGSPALVEIRRGGRCYLYELRLRETRP
jgi:hypothetical protein